MGTDSDTSGDSGTWTYTLAVGTAQAALTITSLSRTVGAPLTLVTSGGSSTGAVTFSVTNGTATGCTITGNSLSATGAGPRLVVATKAGNSTYIPASSAATGVSLAVGTELKLWGKNIVLASHATTPSIRVSCGTVACAGTLSVTARVQVRKSSGDSRSEVIKFGAVGYHLNRKSAKGLEVHLTAARRAYLQGNPNRPKIYGSLKVTDDFGKVHYIERASLLK